MRRLIAFLTLAAALISATTAAAALRPIKRDFGDKTVPRVRVWSGQIPAGHASGRVRVIATLRLPPLAATRGPGILAFGAARTKLDVRTADSRAYLARLEAAQ